LRDELAETPSGTHEIQLRQQICSMYVVAEFFAASKGRWTCSWSFSLRLREHPDGMAKNGRACLIFAGLLSPSCSFERMHMRDE